jgi:hypothetical protein
MVIKRLNFKNYFSKFEFILIIDAFATLLSAIILFNPNLINFGSIYISFTYSVVYFIFIFLMKGTAALILIIIISITKKNLYTTKYRIAIQIASIIAGITILLFFYQSYNQFSSHTIYSLIVFAYIMISSVINFSEVFINKKIIFTILINLVLVLHLFSSLLTILLVEGI